MFNKAVTCYGLLAMGLKPGFGDDMLRFGGVKIFVDGVGHDGYGNRVSETEGSSTTAAQAGPSISWMAFSSASDVGVPRRP